MLDYRNHFLRWIKAGIAPWIVSALVLLVGLSLTFLFWYHSWQLQQNDFKREFESNADQAAGAITSRLEAYSAIVRGAKGYVEGSEKVTASEFRTYVQALHILDKKSGIEGLGLITIVPRDYKLRSAKEIQKLVLPDFTVKPEGERNQYAPIALMEPTSKDNLTLLGLDAFTVPISRDAMAKSLDTLDLTVSKYFFFGESVSKSGTSTFVIYLPFFKPEANVSTQHARNKSVQGWVILTFNIDHLVAGLSQQFDQDIRIEMPDGHVVSEQSLINNPNIKSSKTKLAEGMLQTSRSINYSGHTWTLLTISLPGFEVRATNINEANTIAWAGLAISLLLTTLAWLLANGQQNAKKRYLKLFKQTPSGVLVLNRDNQILDANPAALQMLGYKHEELLSLNLVKIVLEREVDRINPSVEALMARNPHVGEWVHVRKDGSTFLAEVNAGRLDNQSYFAILRDLTKRKENEHRITQLNNLYLALSEVNQAIVRISDEHELFPLVCKCAVKFGGMQLAWIGKVDQVTGLFKPLASYGNGLAYLESLQISVNADLPEGRGPTGTCFRNNKSVITNDFTQSPLTAPWHLKAQEFGWKSSGAFPISRQGDPFAVFTVYSSDTDAFNEEITNLFEEMAADISFALDNFDREMQRHVTQDKLKIAKAAAIESLDRYTDLYEFAPIGYLSINKNQTFAEVNWKVTSIFGLKRTQLNQHYLSEFIVDSEKERWPALFQELQDLEAGQELNFDLRFKHAGGSEFIANLNCLRMDDEIGKPMLRVALLDVTQLKRIEEARRQSEVRLQATIDAIPDSLFEVDINGQFFFVHSPNKYLGLNAADKLIGSTVQEVFPEEATVVVMSAIHEANQKGKSEGKQYALELPQASSWFELSVSKKPVVADEGLRFIILSRDVTERRQFEIKLLESSESLAKAQASAHLGSWELDLVNMVGIWSEENSHLYGRDPALGAPNLAEYLALIHPEDRYIVENFLKQPNAMNNAIKTEIRTNPSLGFLRTLGITINVIRDAHGQAIRATGTSFDLTERKQAELEQRIAATAFESQEGMMVTDVNKVILRVNQAFSRISGYSVEESVGQSPRLVSLAHHHEHFYDSIWQSVAELGGWEGEVWNRRKNGEVYPQHLTITAVFNDNDIVTNYVATFTDVTLRNAAEAEINHLAFYDVLTRLPNRRLLIDRLNHALTTGARLGCVGALLFLDLDHFKTLNDTLGHDVGDMLLRQVAERLSACIREGDTVARLGGDEFVVMLEDLSKQPLEAAAQAEVIAHKILTSISAPYQLAKNSYQTTASIGLVLFGGSDQSQELLLKHADIAMYQAKKMGRNTLCFFDPNMQDAINTRVSLEIDLRKALENHQFELYYQIQVDRLGRPVGAEALIRWHHPERGLILPLAFIALAEETGLIMPLGQWVLETACKQLKIWQSKQQSQNFTLSINVSAKQFYQFNFAAQVQAALVSYDVNPMRLKLELTESIMLENIETTAIKMKELQKIGVQFSLDDFGTGYSSLQYLKMLPIYQLKIDHSFIRDIVTDTSDQAIVRTIIAMAETLNLEVIAEGIESEQQRELLMSCGCNTFQGFLFGKPVPIEQFE